MALPIEIDDTRQEPIYHQIEEQITVLIVSGYLPAESLLPSIRSLANDLGCSVITTRRAYQNLEQHGYIKTYRGKGTFVQNVDLKERSLLKEKTVLEAIQGAVKTAKQHNYSHEEIHDLFINVLEEERDNHA